MSTALTRFTATFLALVGTVALVPTAAGTPSIRSPPAFPTKLGYKLILPTRTTPPK